jgi:hypothetical protein
MTYTPAFMHRRDANTIVSYDAEYTPIHSVSLYEEHEDDIREAIGEDIAFKDQRKYSEMNGMFLRENDEDYLAISPETALFRNHDKGIINVQSMFNQSIEAELSISNIYTYNVAAYTTIPIKVNDNRIQPELIPRVEYLYLSDHSRFIPINLATYENLNIESSKESRDYSIGHLSLNLSLPFSHAVGDYGEFEKYFANATGEAIKSDDNYLVGFSTYDGWIRGEREAEFDALRQAIEDKCKNPFGFLDVN